MAVSKATRQRITPRSNVSSAAAGGNPALKIKPQNDPWDFTKNPQFWLAAVAWLYLCAVFL